MSGINQGIIFSVCRLRITLVDGIGKIRCPVGSGFWLTTNKGTEVFVTNKHNLDPTLKLGEDTDFVLRKVEIQLRLQTQEGISSDSMFFEVHNFGDTIALHETADSALIISPVFKDLLAGYGIHKLLKEENLADEIYFSESVALMDSGSFIGFPGSKDSKWWDQQWELGVARQLAIASYPAVAFTHPDVITSHALLVSGLSFSGSSGSVALLHRKGVNFGNMFEGAEVFVPPKVIGIMSGHFQEDPNRIPKMFQHSGLSYLTLSTTIIDLIGNNKI